MIVHVTKRCSRCGETKPTTEFHFHRVAKHGLQGICRLCRSVNVSLAMDGWSSVAIQRVSASAGLRRKRGLDCAIDIDSAWLDSRIAEIGYRCELSGVKFNMDDSRSPAHPSIDRIDSNLGYTKDNCQIVCCSINYAKIDLTQAEFVAFLAKLREGLNEKAGASRAS